MRRPLAFLFLLAACGSNSSAGTAPPAHAGTHFATPDAAACDLPRDYPGPQPVDVNLVAIAAAPPRLLPSLEALARSDLDPSMKPAAQPFGGELREGHRMEDVVTLGTGGCYSLVAVGADGLSRTDASLVIEPVPRASLPGAQGRGAGPHVVVGGRDAGGCWTYLGPGPMRARAVVTAAVGSGTVAARLYERVR
jgi:hypothetical protein